MANISTTKKTQRESAPVSEADYVAAEGYSLLTRLYTGTGAFQIVARRKRWYAITAAILLGCLITIILRGFSFGIDFKGGTQMSLPAKGKASVELVKKTFSSALGHEPDTVQTAGSGSAKTIQLRTTTLNAEQVRKVSEALGVALGPEVAAKEISSSDVSSTWGSEITEKALIALGVFIVIVTIYIIVRFDFEMALAALASLIFDVFSTAGVYSLLGLEVTPATVIGLLTILGFSIYDTVVVFDKVEENTREVFKDSEHTYAEQANLALNQTLMRSINTTVISVLPILALMVIAVGLLGVGTLKDLGIIQLVGVIVGAYSSLFLATPLLVTLKERKADIKRHTARVLAKRAKLTAQ